MYRRQFLQQGAGVKVQDGRPALMRLSMAQWIGICGVRLSPLADALKDCILAHSVIHVDEAPDRGKALRACVWVYRTTNFMAQRAVLFNFSLSRAGEHARRVMHGFGGAPVSEARARRPVRKVVFMGMGTVLLPFPRIQPSRLVQRLCRSHCGSCHRRCIEDSRVAPGAEEGKPRP